MPFCPQCRDEFREGLTVCQECKTALVESLDDEEDQVEELGVACTLSQEDVAHIIRGYLENEGIPCFLENATFHTAPAPSTYLTKVRLWTKKVDVDRARGLINEHEQYQTCSSCGHFADPEDASCDFCGMNFEN